MLLVAAAIPLFARRRVDTLIDIAHSTCPCDTRDHDYICRLFQKIATIGECGLVHECASSSLAHHCERLSDTGRAVVEILPQALPRGIDPLLYLIDRVHQVLVARCGDARLHAMFEESMPVITIARTTREAATHEGETTMPHAQRTRIGPVAMIAERQTKRRMGSSGNSNRQFKACHMLSAAQLVRTDS